jgi:hypothetical protein
MIHILAANDYLGVVRTLLTPAEVIDYLGFREALINRWESKLLEIPERALVGQYLVGDFDARPTAEFVAPLERLEHRADDWDMSGILANIADRWTPNYETDEYYSIIQELTILRRNELREFKKRFVRSLENARADRMAFPYRMECGTGCGFVFVGVTKELAPNARIGLQNFTFLHKYDRGLARCMGVSIGAGEHGSFTADWCYIEFPWKEEPEVAAALQSNNPFGEVNATELPRYTFRE